MSSSEKRGQVSMEYLAIFSIAVLMILPLILIFASQNGNIQTDITNTQGYQALSYMLASSQQVYYMGSPAQKSEVIQFPGGIDSIDIVNQSIRFNVETIGSNYQMIKETAFNITGNVSSTPGPHTLIFQAIENPITYETYVKITEQK